MSRPRFYRGMPHDEINADQCLCDDCRCCCKRCHSTYSLDDGADPTRYCHPCAQDVLTEIGDAWAQYQRRDIDQEEFEGFIAERVDLDDCSDWSATP